MGRNRLIAAQSLITAVLLGVIAVTLLSPEEQNGLFGVNVPESGDEIVQEAPVSDPPPGDEGDAETGDAPRGGAADAPPPLALTGPAAPGAGTLETAADGAAPTAPAPPPGQDGEGGDDSPPGQQYGDTLARLNDALD